MEKKKRPMLWFEGKEKNTAASPEKPRMAFRGFPIKFNIRFIRPQSVAVPSSFDMLQTNDYITIRAAMPGFTKEDIKLNATTKTIDISAQKNDKVTDKGDNFYKQEMSQSSFRQKLTLPSEIDPTMIRAKLDNGILEIILPKKIPKR